MIASPKWLLLAYVSNIIILVPACHSMLMGSGVAAVFEGHMSESAGLRLLVGSLWLAILVSSIAGLAWPAFFAPVILIQVLYKSVWLLTYVLPLLRDSKPIPTGIAVVFLLIVVSYPFIFWRATQSSG